MKYQVNKTLLLTTNTSTRMPSSTQAPTRSASMDQHESRKQRPIEQWRYPKTILRLQRKRKCESDLPSPQWIYLQGRSISFRQRGHTPGKEASSLSSTIRLREHGVIVDDIPIRHGGRAAINVDGIVTPFILFDGMMITKIHEPAEERNTLQPRRVTSKDNDRLDSMERTV